jgi:hypothetical protein
MKRLTVTCSLVLLGTMAMKNVANAVPVPRRPPGYNRDDPNTWAKNWRELCGNHRANYDKYSKGPQRTTFGRVMERVPVIGSISSQSEQMGMETVRQDYAETAIKYKVLVEDCDHMEGVAARVQPSQQVEAPITQPKQPTTGPVRSIAPTGGFGREF